MSRVARLSLLKVNLPLIDKKKRDGGELKVPYDHQTWIKKKSADKQQILIWHFSWSLSSVWHHRVNG